MPNGFQLNSANEPTPDEGIAIGARHFKQICRQAQQIKVLLTLKLLFKANNKNKWFAICNAIYQNIDALSLPFVFGNMFSRTIESDRSFYFQAKLPAQVLEIHSYLLFAYRFCLNRNTHNSRKILNVSLAERMVKKEKYKI